MTRLFGHGDFRLYLLQQLADRPRHGYELLKVLEERLGGVYAPSAGSIYPRLTALEDEGLIVASDEDGRKVYRITPEGREELSRRADQLVRVDIKIKEASGVAHDIREQVRASVKDMRRDMRSAANDARRDAIQARRQIRDVAKLTREQARLVREQERLMREQMRRQMREVQRVVPVVEAERRGAQREIERDVANFSREILRIVRRAPLVSDDVEQIRSILDHVGKTLAAALSARG